MPGLATRYRRRARTGGGGGITRRRRRVGGGLAGSRRRRRVGGGHTGPAGSRRRRRVGGGPDDMDYGGESMGMETSGRTRGRGRRLRGGMGSEDSQFPSEQGYGVV
jgi:hypothetical protein